MTIHTAATDANAKLEYSFNHSVHPADVVHMGAKRDAHPDVHKVVRVMATDFYLSPIANSAKGAIIGGFTVATASMAAGCFEPSTVACGIIGGAVSGFIKS